MYGAKKERTEITVAIGGLKVVRKEEVKRNWMSQVRFHTNSNKVRKHFYLVSVRQGFCPFSVNWVQSMSYSLSHVG